MQGPKIKVGLVGGGAIMRLSHAPTIKASKDAELVAVFDTDLNRAEGLTREFGGKAFDHLEAMLDVPGFDAVIVATPNKYHEEGVVAAAKHSKHVLCEKPLSVDAAAARRMVKACDDAKVVLQVGFNQRFWAQVEIAKQLIDAGFIGTIHQMRSIYSEKSTAYPATTRFRYNLEQSGGATIIDLTVHRIDLARHLVGDFSGVFGELTHSELPEIGRSSRAITTRLPTSPRSAPASSANTHAMVPLRLEATHRPRLKMIWDVTSNRRQPRIDSATSRVVGHRGSLFERAVVLEIGNPGRSNVRLPTQGSVANLAGGGTAGIWTPVG
jgi:predicted dehydrogenase